MDKSIKVGNGILEQIKHPYYITGTITKKGLFKQWMQMYKADSEEEARELLETGEGDLEYDDYDCTDHSEIIDIKEYES